MKRKLTLIARKRKGILRPTIFINELLQRVFSRVIAEAKFGFTDFVGTQLAIETFSLRFLGQLKKETGGKVWKAY